MQRGKDEKFVCKKVAEAQAKADDEIHIGCNASKFESEFVQFSS